MSPTRIQADLPSRQALDDVPEITISHADTLDELGLEAIPDA